MRWATPAQARPTLTACAAPSRRRAARPRGSNSGPAKRRSSRTDPLPSPHRRPVFAPRKGISGEAPQRAFKPGSRCVQLKSAINSSTAPFQPNPTPAPLICLFPTGFPPCWTRKTIAGRKNRGTTAEQPTVREHYNAPQVLVSRNRHPCSESFPPIRRSHYEDR